MLDDLQLEQIDTDYFSIEIDTLMTSGYNEVEEPEVHNYSPDE